MEIRAYPETYLSGVMHTMAALLDYAVNVKQQNIDIFFRRFITQGFALQLEQSNPVAITGRSCAELYQMIAVDYTTPVCQYLPSDRSPEYWTGWALAYYQWYTCRTFSEIIAVVPVSAMRNWYDTLHEADLMRFVDTLEAQLMPRSTNLEILRKRAGLSQAQLAAMSGVSSSSIRKFEQRQNDISRAQFNTLNALAQVLNCGVYDLMDSNFVQQPLDGRSQGVFMQQLMSRTEPYRAPFSMMDAEQIQQQAQMNAYRAEYVAQFPVSQLNVRTNGYEMSREAFINNWDLYWSSVLQQQRPMSTVEQENYTRMLRKLAKEAISQGLKDSGNHAASAVFDAMCAITADNVAEAVFKALSVIAAVRNQA